VKDFTIAHNMAEWQTIPHKYDRKKGERNNLFPVSVFRIRYSALQRGGHVHMIALANRLSTLWNYG